MSNIAIVGKRGWGKSYAAKVPVEGLLDLGDCDLKASADGERPGYPMAVFGGQHADTNITEATGRALAELLVAEPVLAIIDMGSMRKAEH